MAAVGCSPCEGGMVEILAWKSYCLLVSAGGNKNETARAMHIACLHVDKLDFLDTICVVTVKF